MSRFATRSERLVWSGFVLICGALFLSYSVWQTLMLMGTPPGAETMGFERYVLVTTGAIYFMAGLLLFLGLRGLRRNLRSPA